MQIACYDHSLVLYNECIHLVALSPNHLLLLTFCQSLEMVQIQRIKRICLSKVEALVQVAARFEFCTWTHSVPSFLISNCEKFQIRDHASWVTEEFSFSVVILSDRTDHFGSLFHWHLIPFWWGKHGESASLPVAVKGWRGSFSHGVDQETEFYPM